VLGNVHRAPGAGNRFSTATRPRTQPPSAKVIDRQMQATLGTGGNAAPVLVIEDDESIRALISALLTEAGYSVLTAPNGAAALDLIQQQPPSLILLDSRMPVMDGPAFLRAYRQRPGRQAPVIALSAVGTAAAWEEPALADGVLEKPFELDVLLALVDRFTRPPAG
jgi:CheY-like chemotaxis protein